MKKPFVLQLGDRPRGLDVVGEKITVLASQDRTSGHEVFFQDGVKDTGPPPHSHEWDESFFILSGTVQFGIADDQFSAGPGAFVHVPGGTVHWFRFEGDDAEMLSITGNGSRAADFFTQVDRDVADPGDIETLAAVADTHELRIIPASD